MRTGEADPGVPDGWYREVMSAAHGDAQLLEQLQARLVAHRARIAAGAAATGSIVTSPAALCAALRAQHQDTTALVFGDDRVTRVELTGLAEWPAGILAGPDLSWVLQEQGVARRLVRLTPTE